MWIKIRNRRYSQLIGRDELFEKRYEAAGVRRRSGGMYARGLLLQARKELTATVNMPVAARPSASAIREPGIPMCQGRMTIFTGL